MADTAVKALKIVQGILHNAQTCALLCPAGVLKGRAPDREPPFPRRRPLSDAEVIASSVQSLAEPLDNLARAGYRDDQMRHLCDLVASELAQHMAASLRATDYWVDRCVALSLSPVPLAQHTGLFPFGAGTAGASCSWRTVS